ncbi:hypothetical protein FRX31_027522 [Thalictrum thalictroides]|uniref:Uncharacterized protein n=1 Tax=Thalictrum thalictroides TaxID=46969 RepID=A0A7J6VDX1_THATH|nr:hypothetical protein FRX31_027522 [Thalictrum thalictroides]
MRPPFIDSVVSQLGLPEEYIYQQLSGSNLLALISYRWTSYNVILRKEWIHKMKTIVLPFYQALKFPTAKWISRVKGNQGASFRYHVEVFKGKNTLQPIGNIIFLSNTQIAKMNMTIKGKADLKTRAVS